MAVGVYAGGFSERLMLERAAVQHGELWRLWTGNFSHFGLSHLLWNLAVLVPAGAWAERVARRETRWFLLLAPLAVGAAIYFFQAGLARYAGLSGVVAGVLALLAFVQLGRTDRDRWFWWSILALLAVKIVAESLAGSALFARFSASEIRPVPLAHLVGIGCAALIHYFPRRI